MTDINQKKPAAKFYDVKKLTTAEQCQTVMKRAKDDGLTEIYSAVLKRYCEISGAPHDNPDDPIVREMWEGIAAYENYLFEKHGGKNIKAAYTRRKINSKGVLQSLIEWTDSDKETEGFQALIKVGLPELTGEYIVAKYASRFPDLIVSKAIRRLEKYSIVVLAAT
jgi:hypothetical protein